MRETHDSVAEEFEVRIEQPSLVDMAAERIRGLLLAGVLKPGERVREESLTSRLGISRPPLREAMQVLVQQGLLVRTPRRGVRVVILTEADISDIYSLRAVLDQFAVKLGVPVKDTEALAPLRNAVMDMRTSMSAGDHPRYVDANRRFHLALIGLGHNSRLSSTYELLMNQMQLLMSVNLSRESADDREIGVRRHEDLLAAIESGDVDRTLLVLEAHGEQRFLRVDSELDFESVATATARLPVTGGA